MAKDMKDTNSGKDGYKAALRTGVWVLILLGIFTAGEFLVATIAPPWGVYLLLVAVAKAIYVVKDYMHVGRVFGGGEETH